MRLRCRLGDNRTELSVLEGRIGVSHALSMLRPGDTYVDAGANCGVYTAFGGKAVGPQGRVIAIEPQPRMLERLKYNVAINSLSNVSIFAAALGETAGTQPMSLKPRNLGASTLLDAEGSSPPPRSRASSSTPTG